MRVAVALSGGGSSKVNWTMVAKRALPSAAAGEAQLTLTSAVAFENSRDGGSGPEPGPPPPPAAGEGDAVAEAGEPGEAVLVALAEGVAPGLRVDDALRVPVRLRVPVAVSAGAVGWKGNKP